MSWDIDLSTLGDFVFSANHDLNYVEGFDLLNQRIIVRLKIHRGSWIYDTNKSLGSRLATLLGKDYTKMSADAESFVMEALLPMLDEIAVDHVQVVQDINDPRSISLLVTYHPVLVAPDSGLPIENTQIRVSVPLQG